MQKLDRLGWAAGVSFEVYGLTMGVRVTDVSALPAVEAVLPHGWRPAPTDTVEWLYSFVVGGGTATPGRVRRFHVVYTDALQLARTRELDHAIEALQRDMNLMVGERARNRVFVHAGVVAFAGVAVMLPGRTLAGKSTLVAALVRAGATYYSDEFAVLDEDGLVHPFARPLSIRPHADERGVPVAAEELGGDIGTLPLPVGAVVFTRYREGARWRSRRLSPGRCVLGLIENCLSARYKPDFVLPVLQRVAEAAVAVTTQRGEATETATRVRRLVARLRASQ